MSRHVYDKKAVTKYHTTPRGRAMRLCVSSRVNARKAGLDHNLTKEWVEERIKSGCSKTGLAFDLDHPGGAGFSRTLDRAPSLDRIDPEKGYTTDNVQVVCRIYNRAKLRSSDEDVLNFARALVAQADGGSNL